MGLFNKTRPGIMDVIRCDEPKYLVWKWRPDGTSLGETKRENAIRWGSSIRVKEGSVAVFVYSDKNGSAQDCIEGPADIIADTNNLPVISSLVGLAYKGGSPFQAEVYFINLANTVQIKFSVPYFDVFDSELTQFSVPIAVRGSIDFNICDYKAFIKIHRLDHFSIADLSAQIKDTVSEKTKSVVANAPDAYGIPVIQIERKIAEIKTEITSLLQKKLDKEYGVTVKDINIEAIDIDKDSEGYQELKSVTKDLTAEAMKSRNKAKIVAERREIKGEQALGLFAKAAAKLGEIKEERFIRHKQAQTEYADAVENERAGRLGAAGAKIIGAYGKMRNPQQKQSEAVAVPPPIRVILYYVAVNGQQTGPFDMETLAQMAENDQLTVNSLVWRKGMGDWVKAGTVDELKYLFEEVPPAL